MISADIDDRPRNRTYKARKRPLVRLRFLLWLLVLLVFAAAAVALWVESQYSLVQSRLIPEYAQSLTYELESGSSDAIRFPVQGPFDMRLGYVRMPTFLERLQARGLQVDAQVRMSSPLLQYIDFGLYPPYPEKANAGLEIRDRNSEVIHRMQYPRWAYENFAEIPSIVHQVLIFIEDRDVLNAEYPHRNPAINWHRFIKAGALRVGEYMGLTTDSMGGSTLATQIEKYRHSDDGMTSSVSEKLRQIASASVRAYANGEETMPARRQLVLDYLNTVPLSAAPGYGEVNGLGDGLHVWFGVDPNESNRLLRLQDAEGEELQAQAQALRQVVALMIAHRRPSDYLARSRNQLETLTDSHLRVLAREGFIRPALLNAALEQRLVFRHFQSNPAVTPHPTDKGFNMVRTRLGAMLNASLYDLDRLDLRVQTTLDGELQRTISDHLKNLLQLDYAKAHGLIGEYLLTESQTPHLNYSFTLFETTPTGNRVRVQTDNTDMIFDINESSKLELGSTAKLRVLATYLEIIAEIWYRHHQSKPDALRIVQSSARDVLTRWTLEIMINYPGISLGEMLSEALQRRYSASPAERFFTGGGMHVFGNFKKEDNGRNPSVLESLQESINLPFVRMLRDIMKYSIEYSAMGQQQIMEDESNPRRQELLNRFIERESAVFMRRFWNKYYAKPATERMDAFLSGLKLTPRRLSVIHRYLFPDSDIETFSQFLRKAMPEYGWEKENIPKLYAQYTTDRFSLQDVGYLARVHPLELWLLGYLRAQEKELPMEQLSLSKALDDSAKERREIYNWLMKTKAKNARDSRIRTMLEVEAFSEIHRRWKRLGYAFDHLVPSLATALGSSGDRPAALAEFMGIIQNRGLKMPVYRIDKLEFAENTPYETHLSQKLIEPEQVMDPIVADTLRYALSTVVQNGTGRRIKTIFRADDGEELVVGGKTGTGDNRLVMSGPGGQRVKTRALSRTATFVFYLGDRHFGTITAFVPGNEAQNFSFTSALPVQVLKSMAPMLQPYLGAPGSPINN